MRSIPILATTIAVAWGGETYRVPLEVQWSDQQPMYYGTELKVDDATHLHATMPGGVELRAERMSAPLNGIVIEIPGAEPARLTLLPDQSSRVILNRQLGKAGRVPYTLSYDRRERGGEIKETLGWIPGYRAEGTLKLPRCEVNLAIFDLNGDGVFDRNDSKQGTTLAFDLNHDGRFFGPAEWRKTAEIIEICGSMLEVAEVDPAGTAIVFRESELRPAAVGAPVPRFSVPAVTGRILRSEDFRGKVHLLDFWASWCAPCVAELEKIDVLALEHPADLQVYGIDVDEPERRAAANRVLAEKHVSYPMVIREQGEKDFLWKMFGSAGNARLSIPLFVVVDREGVIRYASHGGEDLADLKAALAKALSAPAKRD